MNAGHCAIIGKGSVAAATGWMLQSRGLPFYFVGRSGPQRWAYEFEVRGQSSSVSALPPPDLSVTSLVLVCTKAYDLADAFTHLVLFSGAVTVLPFANGATSELVASAAQLFPRHLFRTGFATLGVSKIGPEKFVLRSTGGSFCFGPATDGGPGLTEDEARLIEGESVNSGGPTFQWSVDVRTLQRRKWLFNTVINTLTAARMLTKNGDLLADLPSLAAVFSEAFSLGEDLWGPWSEHRSDLYEKMLRLIQDTQENENSMAADVRCARPTESDFLAGLCARDPGRYPLLTDLHAKITRSGSV